MVSSIERSLPLYRGLLEPIGWTGLREVGGEQGETIHYLSVEGPGVAALGLRKRRSDAYCVPYDRYAVGSTMSASTFTLARSSTNGRGGSASTGS